MTVHHTGAVLGDNSNAPGRLRQHQRLHQGERGWIDIAYHVGVDRNGNIYALRAPELVGDTATEYDPTGHFLVLCEGDFDQESVSEAQLNGAALAFAWGAQRFKIPTNTLAGHRDFAATACPGSNLYAHVQSGDLRSRVEEMVAAGPVNLQEICGPEAAERVAAIEAGQ
ncbi:peptidoglycan recognition family protein [Mycobacterium sp. URHB0044]|uniref:peptidoglycan recognition protein family protein n=1 Tax=Mycobacterium sp. URHB0044 TaxID=1380386 RepID=UPI00048D3BB5|nr:peptidoglycan recognition family protein [Mycobacterium sp. URHB0044]